MLNGVQSERFLVAGGIFMANPDERPFEKLYYRREDFVPRQTRQRKIFTHAFANFRERVAKNHDAVVLVLIPKLAPAIVITILFAAPRVATDRLNVAVGRRTNPNICPCWRN